MIARRPAAGAMAPAPRSSHNCGSCWSGRNSTSWRIEELAGRPRQNESPTSRRSCRMWSESRARQECFGRRWSPSLKRLSRVPSANTPRNLADAIYPVIGPALRSSIAAAIREFAECLNQIVEKSASLRAIRWRIEARVTGQAISPRSCLPEACSTPWSRFS